ncbi:MAG TPA: lytic transglycosylase domain-containing protein [Vicinamibacterales bacterium]|nr:lytic transglycosylase domain-containing protein [Vicinamibacterales bacterium]
MSKTHGSSRSTHGAHQAHPQKRRRGRGHGRRAVVKGVLIGAMMFGATAKPKAKHRLKDDSIPVAEVTVSMDSFAAIPPYLAYDDIIAEAARTVGLDADLIHAVIQTESMFNPRAESPVGAQGLMQLMPALQKDLGVLDPFDPRQNIMAGAEYLKKLMNKHNDDIALALASYNAGPGNVAKYKGVPPFRETRNYVKKIKAILEETSGD